MQLDKSVAHRIICLALPLAVLAAIWPATWNGFVNYDDPAYVVRNPIVQQGPTRASLCWALTTGHAANWHPLTWFSHMLDCRFFGLQPWGHHLTSVLIHALNALLVYLVLRQLTGATWRSLGVAALFGLHPLRVKSVAWVAERKDVLSTLFWLLAIWSYAAWVRRGDHPGNRRFWCLSLVCFGLGLMSKPMVVTLPFVLLLLDYWPLRRMRPDGVLTFGSLVAEKVPFFSLAAAACLVTFQVQHAGGAVQGNEKYPFLIRLGNAVMAYAQYLGNFFDPRHLAIFYPHPGLQIAWHSVWCAGALLLGISAVTVWQRHARPWLVVGWLWYLGTLVPVIGSVQVGNQARADRYTYVPMIGLTMTLVWTAQDFAARWRVPVIVRAGGLTACLVLCFLLTRFHLRFWHDSETLFRRAIAVTPPNAVAHGNLAGALEDRGALPEAISELDTAIQIDPKSSISYLGLGMVLDSAGWAVEVVVPFARAAALDPTWPEAAYFLARTLDRTGQHEKAVTAYENARRLDPENAEIHRNLGALYFRVRRYDEAVREFQELRRLQPGSADAYNDLGGVLAAQRRWSEAIPYLEEALRLQPDHAEARRNLDRVRAAMGRTGELIDR